MNKEQFEAFDSFRNDFKNKCQEWDSVFACELRTLQKEASKKDTPEYPLETSVVYNKALDEVTEDSVIRYFVIGDNPGKDEQLKTNNRYLVGQSGKIAAGFFKKHPEFECDFRKNVIILNKTPVHTAKTNHLKFLMKNGGDGIAKLINDSQLYMAEKTADLHKSLCVLADEKNPAPELWLVGYAELKKKGIFGLYRDTLKMTYGSEPAWEKVFVYQHFSMNRFSIDLKSYNESAQESLKDSLIHLGKIHKKEIFG